MMEQREYWDKMSDEKQFTPPPFQTEAFRSRVAETAAILDVGCGYGRTLQELYETGYRNLVGVDFSREMIARGNRQFPHLDLRVMEAGSLPFDDGSVDAVILFAVLTCISSDQEQQALLDEIRRVLRPGGILYVNDFLLNTDDRNVARYKKHHQQHGGAYGVFALEEGGVLHHHDQAWLEQLLSPFRRLEYQRLTFTTMNGNQSNGMYYIGEKK